MKIYNSRNVLALSLLAIVTTGSVMSASAAGFPSPSLYSTLQRGQQKNQQQNRPQQPPRQQQEQQHARRDVVRTNNYVPPHQAAPVPPTRGRDNAPPRQQVQQPNRQLPQNQNQGRPEERQNPPARIVNDRKFTKTPEGRHYDNGLTLRKGIKVTASWEKRYFPKGYAHYPYYRDRFVRGQAYYSPFGFYFGIALPYISVQYAQYYPPSVVYIDPTVYNGPRWVGFSDSQDENYLDNPNINIEEPGLSNALDELTEAYQSSNIDGLVALTEPSVSVAVYLRGQYQYTMPSNDYLDLTRDALRNIQTDSFNVMYVHRRAPGVFSVDAQHIYQGQNGQTRTVYVTYVLQDFSGQWTITQVGTSPDIIQDL